jgi:hypothetical protein
MVGLSPVKGVGVQLEATREIGRLMQGDATHRRSAHLLLYHQVLIVAVMRNMGVKLYLLQNSLLTTSTSSYRSQESDDN